MAQAAPNDLWRALNVRVEELRRKVCAAMRWDADAIHNARVCTRHLKAAVDLLDPVLSDGAWRRFTKALRRLRKIFGPLRDFDVMLGHLDGLKTRRSCSAAVAWMVRSLQHQRAEVRRESARRAPTAELLAELGCWWGLEDEVRTAQAAAQALWRRAAPAQLKSFTQDAHRLAAARRDPDTASADQDVHALRIAGKALRYTLELAEPVGLHTPAGLVRSFKKLQNSLGLWHDYAILADRVLRTAVSDELAVRNARLFSQALELSRLCHHTAQRHLDHFVRLWDRQGPSMQQQMEKLLAPAYVAPRPVVTIPPRAAPVMLQPVVANSQ